MSEIKYPEMGGLPTYLSRIEVRDLIDEAIYADRRVRDNELQEIKRQLAALTEDYKDLEAQLLAVGAGGVSKLMGDKE